MDPNHRERMSESGGVEMETGLVVWAAVIVSCPFKKNAVVNAVDTVLSRNDIEELIEGKLSGKMVWGNGGMLCEAEGRDELEDPNNGTGA